MNNEMWNRNGSISDVALVMSFCEFCGVPMQEQGEYCQACLLNQNTGKPCACGQPSKEYLCHNDKSPISGKHYYTCAKLEDDCTRCEFYEYEGGPAWVPPPLGPDMCFCGKASVIRVVRKSTKKNNLGRKFMSCANKPPRGCDFFKWTTDRQTKSDRLRAAQQEAAQRRAASHEEKKNE